MLPAMKITHTAALILALCAAPAFAAAPLQNQASVRPVEGKIIGKIRGDAGILGVQGDVLEFTHGVVRINGTPVATVPKVCEIKYIVDGTRRTFYVNGKQRALPEIPPPPAVMHIGGLT